ncbi:MAG: hypothetical protein Kapaf2KO_02190 [Candidatus Kapaibacteriales bacterium]
MRGGYMMKNQLIKVAFLAILFSGLALQSCDDDDSGTEPTDEAFVPDNTTFADWQNWDVVGTYDMPGPELGEMAHGGQNTDFVRTVYAPSTNSMSDGEYSEGSLFFKKVTNTADNTSGYFAMAKRDSEFDVNQWEYFILNEDGSIKAAEDGSPERGGSSYRVCQGCHAGSSATDFVFTEMK